MNRSQFLELNRKGKLSIKRTCACTNNIPSDTDPTQNVRVSQVYDAMVEGKPLDLRQYKQVFSRVPAEQMTAIDRRNYDLFDAFREMSSIQRGVNKTIKQISLKPKQNENEEN